MNIKKLWRAAVKFVDKNSPEIGLGLTIAGAVVTTILAVKGTLDAKDAIDEYREENDIPENEKLPVKTVAKVCWKHYIGTGIALGGTIGSAVAGYSASARHCTEATILWKLSEEANNELKKSIDKFATPEEKKEIAKDIRENSQNDIFDEQPENVASFDGGTKRLFRDYITGRTFFSTKNGIYSRVNDLNGSMLDGDDPLSFNDGMFYISDGQLDPIDGFGKYGWSVSKFGSAHKIQIEPFENFEPIRKFINGVEYHIETLKFTESGKPVLGYDRYNDGKTYNSALKEMEDDDCPPWC